MTMSRIGIYSLAGAAALSIVLSPAVAMAAPIPAGAVGFMQSPASQANAVKKAKEYLDYSSFSAQGLYEQLVYEGFTASQAVYGVRAVGL